MSWLTDTSGFILPIVLVCPRLDHVCLSVCLKNGYRRVIIWWCVLLCFLETSLKWGWSWALGKVCPWPSSIHPFEIQHQISNNSSSMRLNWCIQDTLHCIALEGNIQMDDNWEEEIWAARQYTKEKHFLGKSWPLTFQAPSTEIQHQISKKKFYDIQFIYSRNNALHCIGGKYSDEW